MILQRIRIPLQEARQFAAAASAGIREKFSPDGFSGPIPKIPIVHLIEGGAHKYFRLWANSFSQFGLNTADVGSAHTLWKLRENDSLRKTLFRQLFLNLWPQNG